MQLSDLQNKHNDEVIFVVGAGPSINNINFELLRDYTIMAVNSGILATSYIEYMVSDDPAILNWTYFDDVERSDCVCLFFENRWRNVDIKSIPMKRVAFYNHKSWFSPPDIYNLSNGLILTKDITKPIVGSRTSFSSCVHLAYCMGAKVIVLLGNDCQLSKDKYQYRYFWQYWEKKKRPSRVKGHVFTSRTQNVGFGQKDFQEYWNKFAEVNKEIIGKKVEIIDCSDSSLTCFPKMHIKEILDRYGDRRK